MNTSQVSEINEFESDLTDREGDVEEDSDKEKNQNVIESNVGRSNEENNENEDVKDDIIYIETDVFIQLFGLLRFQGTHFSIKLILVFSLLHF
jgi:hypothetical protein